MEPIVRVSKIGKLIKISAAKPEQAAALAEQYKTSHPGHLVLINTAPFSASALHNFKCAS